MYLIRMNRGLSPKMHIWNGKDTLCEQLVTGRLDMDNYRIEAEQEENGRLCFGCERRQRRQQQQQQQQQQQIALSELRQPKPDAYRVLMEARKAERAAFDEYVKAVGGNGLTLGTPAPNGRG